MLSEILSQIYAATLPPLLLILSTILGRIIAKAAMVAKDRWGIEIEARHREALQSAMMTGISAALAYHALRSALSDEGESVTRALVRPNPMLRSASNTLAVSSSRPPCICS